MTGIPGPTVSNILTGKTASPSFGNIRDMVVAMDGSLDELTGIRKDEPQAPTDHTKLIELYERGIESKNKMIVALFALAVLLIAFIIGVFIFDLTHPNIGYFVSDTRLIQTAKGVVQSFFV